VLGHGGIRSGGLTVGALEDFEGGVPRTTKARAKPKRKPNRRGEIYSDEDEDYRRGRTKEDEYDEEDGFLVGSDEEPEMVSDVDAEGEEDPDVDDLEIEGQEAEEEEEEEREKRPARRERAAERERDRERQGTPKRKVEESPAEEGPASGSPHARKKHRYVVDDEDDE